MFVNISVFCGLRDVFERSVSISFFVDWEKEIDIGCSCSKFKIEKKNQNKIVLNILLIIEI